MTDTAHIAAKRIPNTLKTAEDLAQWREFARRDDCLDRMVPSDLRVILSNLAFHPAPQWQPISTAPKDGTKILLFGMIDTEHKFDLLRWTTPAIFSGRWNRLDEAWVPCGGTWEGPFMFALQWMPLPAPPAATEKGLV